MRNTPIETHNVDKIKTYRWLFYISLFQILVLFAVPMVILRDVDVPAKTLLSLELLAALTVGVLFALFFLGINIYGLFVDKHRKGLYVVMIVLMTSWVLWAAVTWSYIEYMDYLLQ